MKTYEKQKNHYQLCLLLFNNNVDLKNKKKNYKICFNSILINHEITCDAVMKATLFPRRPFFVGLGRQCHRSPASLLTAFTSHCRAALPAKIFEFSSHMRQNA